LVRDLMVFDVLLVVRVFVAHHPVNYVIHRRLVLIVMETYLLPIRVTVEYKSLF